MVVPIVGILVVSHDDLSSQTSKFDEALELNVMGVLKSARGACGINNLYHHPLMHQMDNPQLEN